MDETVRFESKRVSGKMVHKAIETIAAFANTEGGHLVLGMEDFKKAQGDDRLFGIQENPEAVDELRRKIEHGITPALDGVGWRSIPCILRDGTEGTLVVVEVPKSTMAHSVCGRWYMETLGTRQQGNDRQRGKRAVFCPWGDQC